MDRRAVLGLGAVSLGLAAGAAGAAGAQGRDGQDAGGGPEPAVQVLSGGRPEYGPALAAIGRLVERHRQAFGLPGMTVSVADADGFAAVINAGWADADRKEAFTSDRLVQIGSISKSLVGLCIFRQIQAGRVALATPMRDILPDVPWPDGTPITLGHLLNHSSGLPDDAPVFPRGGDGRLWRGYEPGSSWSYSNTGYHLLGWTLERLHGRSLPEVIEGEALAPLGMAGQAVGALRAEDRHRYAVGRSPYVQDLPAPTPGRLGQAAWVDSADGAGCVAATSTAMTAYVRWLIGAARGHGGALLDDAHAARFCAPGVDAPGWGMPGARYAHGLAVVQAGGRTYLHHTGGMIAFNSSLHVDGAAGVGAFASTNVGLIVYRPRAVTAYACEALRAVREGREPLAPPEPQRPAVEAAYLGAYRAASGAAFEIRRSGDETRLSVDGRDVVLEAIGDDLLLAHDPAFARYPLAFERAGGKVAGAWLGSVFYAAGGASAVRAAPSPALAALAGRYDNDDPWRGAIRVVARGEGLWLDGAQPLIDLGGGVWRVGADPHGAERVRFDAVVAGRPQRMNFSGVDYLRRPDRV